MSRAPSGRGEAWPFASARTLLACLIIPSPSTRASRRAGHRRGQRPWPLTASPLFWGVSLANALAEPDADLPFPAPPCPPHSWPPLAVAAVSRLAMVLGGLARNKALPLLVTHEELRGPQPK